MPSSFPILVVVFTGLFGLAAIFGTVIWISVSRSKREAEAKAWPTTEARIQHASTIALGRYTGPIPCFRFRM